MTQTFKAFIAFCDENKDYAHNLEQLVSNVDFFRISDSDLNTDESIAGAVKLFDTTGFVLISDNFLKSQECMFDILSIFDDVDQRDKFSFIIIDGIDKSGKPYSTELSHINHVIHYMNYWQSAYDMLRVHLQSDEDEEASKESLSELNKLQNIAGSTGEFLRILRKEGLFNYSDLIANNQALLIKHLESTNTIQTEAIVLDEKASLAEVVLESEKIFSEKQATNSIIQKIIQHETSPTLPEEENVEQAVEKPKNMDEDQAQKVRSVLAKLKQLDQEKETPDQEKIDKSIQNIPEENDDTSIGSFPFDEPLEEKRNKTENSKFNLFELGKKLVTNANYSQAVQVFDTFVKNYPDDDKVSETRLVMANLYVKKLNQFEKASEQLELLISRGDWVVESYELLAEISELDHNSIVAKTFYEKIIQIEPNSPKIHYKLGLLCQEIVPIEIENCIYHFKKAIEFNSKNVDAHFQLGKLYAKLDKNNKAINHLSKVLNFNSRHPFAAFEKASIFKAMGDMDMAIQYYQLACETNDEYESPEYAALFQDDWMIPEGQLLKKLNTPDAYPNTRSNYRNQKGYENPNPKSKLKSRIDKTVLITGATSGIGKATAQKFAEAGYKIIMTGRREERLQAIASEFKATYDTPITYMAFDVRDRSFVMNLFDELEEEWRNVDILINNAGLALGLGPIHEGDLDQWETMIDTNLKGLLYMIRAVAPSMVRKKSGHIINIASIAGKEIYPNGNVYIATKHAVDALTKAARVDLSAHNIRVSQVAPGHVEATEFAKVRFSGDDKKAKIYEDFNPVTSDDVADAIFYIATRAPHVNIQDILMMGTQQANATTVHRTGRIFDKEA